MTLGLSSAEVAEQQRKGLSNKVDLKSSRSVWDIIKTNLLSTANVILLSIMGVLFVVGKPGDAFATGGVVFVNIILGAFQEYRAKRKLDQIALLTRPKVTVMRDGREQQIDQAEVVVNDALVLRAGDQAVVDGKRVSIPDEDDKRLEMDESLLTGESDLILKKVGDEILSGSFCVTGEGVFIAEKVGNESFAQKITAGAREYTVSVTPLQQEIAVLVRVLVVIAIALSALTAINYAYNEWEFSESIEEMAVIISLVPQGLLLMITVAYALGAVRIAQKGALVQQSNAIESLSNVDVLCLDKTGTLTTNRILLKSVHSVDGVSEDSLQQKIGDYISSTGAKNRTAEAISEAITGTKRKPLIEVPFSSARKWAAASFEDGTYVLGAPEMIHLPDDETAKFAEQIKPLADQGLRVLLFLHSEEKYQAIPEQGEPDLIPNLKPLGLISFTDELRPNVQQVLANFRKAGITLKLISGDNPDTVASLAYQAGFDPDRDPAISSLELSRLNDFEFAQAVRENSIFGRITPDQKQKIVEALRADGHYVAMMGDGVNDVLSLKKAQVGIAMEDGSQATRAAADIVLLGNKFEVLPDAFLEGQRIINAMNDVTRLFLSRTLYTAVLIVIVGFMGAAFPFSPRHNFILTSVPLGIPVFFLATWAKTGVSKRGLLSSVSAFVFPAGMSLMVLITGIWVLYLRGGDATPAEVEEARTVLTLTATLAGLLLIIFAEHSRNAWRRSDFSFIGDTRRLWLAIIMGLMMLPIMAIESVRESFELTPLALQDYAVIVGSVVLWSGGLYVLLRFDLLEHLLIPNYHGALNDDSDDPRDNIQSIVSSQ